MKHFGIGKGWPPPKICTDCGQKLPIPVYKQPLGPWYTECTCGCLYIWQDPWVKHHRLELWDTQYKKENL